MKSISSINSWIIGTAALIITGVITYRVGLFILDYPVHGPILLLTLIIPLLVLLQYPRLFIYSMILFLPLTHIFMGATALQLGGAEYLSINVGGILKIMGLGFGILFLFLRKTRIFKYELTVPMILFLGVLMFGVLLVPYKLYALRNWTAYAMPALFYFLILESFNDLKDVNKLLKIVLLSLAYPAVIGLAQMIFITKLTVIEPMVMMAIARADEVELISRISGTYANPNSFALILSIISILTIFFFYEMRHKWIYVISFITAVFLLVNTYSRTAWAAFFVAIFTVGVLKHRKFYLVFLLTGILIIAALPVVLPSAASKLAGRVQEKAAFINRIAIAKKGWGLFKQKPIWGHGMGSFSFLTVSKELRQETIGQKFGYGMSVGRLSAHNQYIEFLAEGGIMLITAYLFFMYRTLKLSTRIFKLPHPTAKNYGVFLIAMIIMILVAGLASSGFKLIALYFFVFMAVGEIYLRQLQQNSEKG